MKHAALLWILGIVSILLLVVWGIMSFGLNVYDVDVPVTAKPSDCGQDVRFAVIGDYGEAGQAAADVAALVDSWQVDFIVTTGDNNYPNGEAGTIDQNIGQHYHAYIHPYQGIYGPGAEENRFFPALGNHDWDTGSPQPYLDYFDLPGNGRYYDFERGPVHFFVLDSDPREPDGRTRDSVQADWLQGQMGENDSPWRLVVLHHPPYSSSLLRGDNKEMQWPFARWGAAALLAGHEHLYEGGYADDIPQFVVGLSGKWRGFNPVHRFGFQPAAGSRVRYNQDYGAMLVNADEGCINFTLYNRSSELIDSYTLTKPGSEIH
jgi:hypothetical protein